MAKVTRDHRIDLLRGLALASIFINHMPGNWLERWTTRNFGFSDAAEIFVLLAGFAAALAFYPRLLRGDGWGVAWKAGRRAGRLYGAHIAATAAAAALFWAFATISGNPDALDLIGIAPLFTDPIPGLAGIAIGGHQLGYFNILPLYVVLLAMLPGILWLARRDVRLALGVSAVVYLAANLAGLGLPNFPTDGTWFFNPFAWQILFVIGIALGIARLEGRTVPWSPYLFSVCCAYLGFSAVWTVAGFGGIVAADMLPEWLGTLRKTNMPATRLLHVLAGTYVLCQSRAWGWLERLPRNFPLTRMGRNSLPVFVAGSLLSMAGWIVLIVTDGGVVMQTLVVAAGLSLMWAVAFGLERATVVRQPARAPAFEAATPVFGDAEPTPTITLRR